MGVVTSAYDYGTLTFALVVIQVTFKVRPSGSVCLLLRFLWYCLHR